MPDTNSEPMSDGRLTRFTPAPISTDPRVENTVQKIKGSAGRYLEEGSPLIKRGISEHEAGKYSEAEALFAKALVIGERALGTDHPALLAALTGVAAAQMSRGATPEAESTLARALAIAGNRGEEAESELMILLNDLVRLCLKHALHPFAEPALLRLLAIKRSKGEDRPEVATVLASLAFVHHSMGRHQSAEQLWTRVVEIRELTLAPNHLSVATALEHLADTCTARGRIGQAVELLERAQGIREITLGHDHSSLRVSRERIADLQLQAAEGEHEDSFPTALPRIGRVSSNGTTDVRNPVADEPAPTAGTAITAIPRQEPDPAPLPYREVILSIQAELESADEAPGPRERLGVFLTSAAERLRQRDRSVEIGVAAMTLVLIAFAGSRAWGKMEDAAVAETTVDHAVSPSVYVPSVTRAPVVAEPLAVPSHVGTTVGALSSPRSRVTERSAAARTRANAQPRNQSSALPTAVGVNLDSVAGLLNAPSRDVGEAILQQAAGVTVAGTRSSFDSDAPTPAQPAKLIGAMPVPRYPKQLSDAAGDVQIRFMVDSLGRPMMNTFSVISSPDIHLSAAVRDVVPRMRFEPARTEGPESRPVSEWVGTVFRFRR